MNYRWWLTKKKKNASWPKLPSIVGKECVCLLYFENEKQKPKETTNNKKQLKLHLNKTFKNCFLFPCCFFFFINSFLFFEYISLFLYKKFLFSYFVKEKICILCMETDRHFCANLNTLVCVCVYEKSSRSRPNNSPIGDDHANMHSALSLICKNLPTPKQQQQNSRRNKKKTLSFVGAKSCAQNHRHVFAISLLLSLLCFLQWVLHSPLQMRERRSPIIQNMASLRKEQQQQKRKRK